MTHLEGTGVVGVLANGLLNIRTYDPTLEVGIRAQVVAALSYLPRQGKGQPWEGSPVMRWSAWLKVSRIRRTRCPS